MGGLGFCTPLVLIPNLAILVSQKRSFILLKYVFPFFTLPRFFPLVSKDPGYLPT